MIRGHTAQVLDADHFAECPADRSSWAVRTKIDTSAVIENSVAAPVSGEQVYAAVCSGCHAAAIVRIGPPVAEIQDKYRGNPDGIAKFATMPKQVRKGFPPMPPQDYLGQARLKAAAEYMLSLKTGS
jgi:cytochrome c551/c552